MVKLTPDNTNMLTKESAADYFQVRSVSEQRFVKKLGKLEGRIMDEMRRSLAVVLSIGAK
jgi:mRNA interferase MazF